MSGRRFLLVLLVVLTGFGLSTYLMLQWSQSPKRDDDARAASVLNKDLKQSAEKIQSAARNPQSAAHIKKPSPQITTSTAAAKQPAEQANLVIPSFDVVRIDQEGAGILAGRAGSKWEVVLKDRNKNKQIIAQTKADSSGQWLILTEKPFDNGSYSLIIEARSQDKKHMTRSEQTVEIAISDIEKNKIIVRGQNKKIRVAIREKNKPLRILQGIKPHGVKSQSEPRIAAKRDSKPPRIVIAQAPQSTQKNENKPQLKPQPNEEKDKAPITELLNSTLQKIKKGLALTEDKTKPELAQKTKKLTLLNVSKIEFDKPQKAKTGVLALAGNGLPGGKVQIFLGKNKLGEAKISKQGEWQFNKKMRLRAGMQKISFRQMDISGELLEQVERSYNYKTETPVVAARQESKANKQNAEAKKITTDIASRPKLQKRKTQKVQQAKKLAATPRSPKRDKIKTRRPSRKQAKRVRTYRRSLGTPHQRKYYLRRQNIKRYLRRKRVTVRRGDSLWRIAKRHYGRGTYYPDIYYSNKKKIKNPDLIYPKQRFVLP